MANQVDQIGNRIQIGIGIRISTVSQIQSQSSPEFTSRYSTNHLIFLSNVSQIGQSCRYRIAENPPSYSDTQHLKIENSISISMTQIL